MAAVGDPFQPVATGLLLGARESGQRVLLGGGSQMLAVLAIALSVLPPHKRERFVEGVTLGTTSWLCDEGILEPQKKTSFVRLIDLLESYFGVDLLVMATGLRFHGSMKKKLRDYEDGYIKEGVGAGALALLAQVKGVSLTNLVEACENAVQDLEQNSVK